MSKTCYAQVTYVALYFRRHKHEHYDKSSTCYIRWC